MRSTIKSEAEATARYPKALEKKKKKHQTHRDKRHITALLTSWKTVWTCRSLARQGTFAYDVNMNATYLTVVRYRNIITNQAKYDAHKGGHAREGVDLSDKKFNPAAL